MRKQPTYQIVVMDARKPRNGRAVDIVGSYSPQRKDKPLTLDLDKVDKWLSMGAQPTVAAQKIVDRARKADGEHGTSKVFLTSTPKMPKVKAKVAEAGQPKEAAPVETDEPQDESQSE